MREPFYNQRFDDIYFSPEDGLAETGHVFLKGNNLPARWQGRKRFTIAETGFGTGLNFLAAWKLFEETAAADQVLDFISFELFPLGPKDIAGALQGWQEALAGRLEKMCAQYPLRVPGFHRLQFTPQVRLTLVFDDVNTALPELIVPGGVDAWFLDGFAPSKNPEMWRDTLYQEMARLSAPGATAATFTVAGHVRRGLESAGFAVEKVPGFGRKKEMTVARSKKEDTAAPKQNKPQRIAIIGGGLAGTSCAYILQQQGLQPVIFEQAASLAAGASGNALGLYNPRFTAKRCPESEFYTAAYAQAFRTLSALAERHEILFNPCGALHLINNEQKKKRFDSLCQNGGWHEEHLRYLDAGQASEQAGIALRHDAVFLPDSGAVSPASLCNAYAAKVECRLETPVSALASGKVNGEDFDAVILACGYGAKSLAETAWLPLHTVRGQVSLVAPNKESAALRCNLCYGGYLSAGSAQVLGATFQKWRDDITVTQEDHQDNLANLAENVPALAQGIQIIGGRAALRTASKDHFPVIGQAADAQGRPLPNLYLSLAHGSHGIISALAGAHLIADMIRQQPYSLPRKTVDKLSPVRFWRRAQKKGRKG